MKENLNIRTVLWNQNPEHHVYYTSIEDIFYMIDVDGDTAVAASSPFTIDMGLILLCEEGNVEIGIDMQVHQLNQGDLIFVLPGQIIEHHFSSPDFSGKLIMYSTTFFSSINFPVNFPLVVYDIQDPILHLNEDQFKIVRSFYSTVGVICRSEILPALKKDVFKYLCMAIMTSFKEEIQRHSETAYDQNRVVSKKFLRILARNFKEHRDLQFYADELHLSKKYFSVLIKNETTKTASEWIDEFIVLEAKKMLATTDLTIQEVSNAMNFANQSFFGKFFKRMTGMSPKAYRKTLLDLD